MSNHVVFQAGVLRGMSINHVLFQAGDLRGMSNQVVFQAGDLRGMSNQVVFQAGDLRGITLYQSLDTEGLHTLGTVIVDYRGYRVVGQSIISGILSLVYCT